MLLLVAMLVVGIASVSAELTVDVGDDTFVLPPTANITYNDSPTCNFTVDNFSASIIKINSSELDNYIHSNRLKKIWGHKTFRWSNKFLSLWWPSS